VEARHESTHEQSDGPAQICIGPDGRLGQPPGRSGSVRARDPAPPDARSARGTDRSSSTSAGDLRARLELAELYLRAAGALERFALLAERHAQRAEGKGLQSSTRIEIDRVKRARHCARRGRDLAAQYAQPALNATGTPADR
jgi:hypothetical protein